jgi:hypothetical protein
MGYAKKEKIWAHEGPSTKEKNDEHMKAHVLKKRKEERWPCFKIISYRERPYLQKEYSFSLPFSTHMLILI